MAFYVECLKAGGVLTGEARTVRLAVKLSSTAVVTSSASITGQQETSVSSGLITDRTATQLTAMSRLVSSGVLTSQLGKRQAAKAQSSGVLSSQAIEQVRVVELALSQGVLGDRGDGARHGAALLISRGVLASYARIAIPGAVVSQGVLSSKGTIRAARLTQVARSNGVLVGFATALPATHGRLSSFMVATSVAITSLHAQSRLVSRGLLSSFLASDAALAAAAWLTNGRTGGASRYDRVPGITVCVVHGALIVSDGTRMFRMSMGAPQAVASFLLPPLTLGRNNQEGGVSRSAQKKRLRGIYLNHKADSPMQCTVTGNVDEANTSFTYLAEAATNGAYRNERIKPGRGFIGPDWQLEFANTDGGSFVIDGIEVDVDESSRRV